MSWSVRLMLQRAVSQRTIIATVLAVAILGSSLLGTFTLLLTSSEQRALDVALVRSPASATDLEAELSIGSHEPGTALTAARTALADLTGDVPTTSSEWVVSPPYTLPDGGDASTPLGYVGSVPDVQALATMRSGSWPDAATDSSGRVEVAVPSVAAAHFAWVVGSDVPLSSTATSATVHAVVVGVYDVTGDRTPWARDLLAGAGVDPDFPVPGSFGFLMTSAYGPFVATPDALLTGRVEVSGATVVARPQLDGASRASLDGLRVRLDTAYGDLAAAVGPHVTSTTFTSRLAATVDAARSQLAVTRVSLVVVGLMLTVLAITVLLLAARLLAERRAAEQSLMASRGATGRQVVALAALEALLVAALTTAVAPMLARLLYRLTTAQGVFRRAGLDVDPHLPGTLWVTCAATSLVLGAVLLAPLAHRSTSVVDTDQQRVRQDRHGAVTRSGLDLALVALAVVAYWQLRQYRSPVLASGRIDAVLVTGPALYLLAGAVVALRLVPPVASVAERFAARSRRLVLPLAAWEVGRRPARASGAVLLLTLAVAVGMFAESFLVTWHASQVDQADVQVGTDVRIDRLATAPLLQSAAIAGLPGATALSPVATRTVGLGAAPTTGMLASVSMRVGMVALDTSLGAGVVRGTAPEGTAWGAMLATIAPTDAVTGANLPERSTSLRLTLMAVAVPSRPSLQLLESVVVQDARGLRVTLRLPAVAVDGAPHDVAVALTAATDAPLVGPLAVVGLVSQVLDRAEVASATPGLLPEHVRLDVTVADLRGTRAGAATSTAADATALDPTAWHARSVPTSTSPALPMSVAPAGTHALTTSGSFDGADVTSGAAGFTTTPFTPVGDVPVIASTALLDSLGLGIGDRILLDVGGRTVSATIAASAPYLPSMPHGTGLMIDRDLLTRTLVAAAWTDPLLDEWWLAADADAAPALAATARTSLSATVTSRYELGASLTDGPLRIGVQAALWIVIAASLLLAVAGFTMSAAISVRLRRLELARLEALGATRPGLVRAVVAEHALLGGLGLAAGAALGALLGRLVVPLLTVASDGGQPVPAASVHWPWAAEGALVTLLVVLLGVAVTSTGVALLRPATSSMLRMGDDR